MSGTESKVPATCRLFDEFESWIQKHVPFLGRSPLPMLDNIPPDGATREDIDRAIILITEEYVRRLPVIGHGERCESKFCFHDLFEWKIRGLGNMRKSLPNSKTKLAAEMEALRHEVKALRKKVEDTDEVEALRCEVTALRKQVEEAERPRIVERTAQQPLVDEYQDYRRSIGGPPQRRPSEQELDWAARQRQSDYRTGEIMTRPLRGEPDADWGGD
jgi:hypothetical protein